MNSEDLSKLASFGISPDLLLKAGVRRVTDTEARNDYGIRFSAAADLSGLIFPYLHPITGKRVTARLRRDHHEIDSRGKPQNKYVLAYGDRRLLYFPPGAGGLLVEISARAVIVEAEKSALAIDALAIRIEHPHCWPWRAADTGAGGAGWVLRTVRTVNGSTRKVPSPTSRLLTGKGVKLSSALTQMPKPMRRSGRHVMLSPQELHGRGARVRIVELPELEGVNGPDDFIGLCGDAAFLALLDAASSLLESALADAGKALEELGADPGQASDPKAASRLLETVSAVEEPTYRKVLEKKTAKVLQWPIADVRKGVEVRVAGRLQAAANVKKEARKAHLRALKLDRSALLAALEKFFEERAYLPANAALVLAFFTLNTWVFDLFDTTPYLLLDSATPGCGKNTVLNLLEAFCACAQMLTSASEAALFRTIDYYHPTVLLDEAELLAGHGERADT